MEEIAIKEYKGWQILKMIDEGDLKEGDKVVNEYDVTYIVTSVTEDDQIKYCLTIENNIKYNIKDYPLSPALQFRTFTIKEKEYLTFDEARNSSKKFKYKNWNLYMPISDILFTLYESYRDREITEMLNEKAWEVKK